MDDVLFWAGFIATLPLQYLYHWYLVVRFTAAYYWPHLRHTLRRFFNAGS